LTCTQTVQRRPFHAIDTTDQQHNKTGEWLKDFIKVTMIAFKNEPEATKRNNLTTGLNAHTAKRVAVILCRIEKKIEDMLGKDQFRFRKGKGPRDTTGMLRIIFEWTSEVD